MEKIFGYGYDGDLLTKAMFVEMISARLKGQKVTLKATAAAFGISVPNLSGILKSGEIGKNSKKKITMAWEQWMKNSKTTKLQLRDYDWKEITLDVWKQMISTSIGIDADAPFPAIKPHDLQLISNTFFGGEYSKSTTWSILTQEYTLTQIDRKSISSSWNKWIKTKKASRTNIPAPLPVKTKLEMRVYRPKEITAPLFHLMIKDIFGFIPKQGTYHTEEAKSIRARFAILGGEYDEFIGGIVNDFVKKIIALKWKKWLESKETFLKNEKKPSFGSPDEPDQQPSKLEMRKYNPGEINPALFQLMVKKRLGMDKPKGSKDAEMIQDAFGTYNVIDILVHHTMKQTDKVGIAAAWNEWISLGMPNTTKHDRVRYLNKHVGGHDGLTKKYYDEIQLLATQIKQPKYRKSVFRGIMLKGYEKKIVDVMKDRPQQLSTLEGGGRYAESWSVSPAKAVEFAESHGVNNMFVVMEARPSPKDIIIVIDKYLMDKIEDVDRHDKNSIVSYVRESEVVVRTGNRKYTLCKNIRYLNIPSYYLQASGSHDINVLIPIVKKIKDAKNLARFQRDLMEDRQYFRFACGGGNLVYLASDRAASTWHRKLASR